MSEQEDNENENKNTVIFILNDLQRPSSVLFHSTKLHRVYVYNNLELYAPTIKQQLLSTDLSMVIPIFSTYDSFLALLQFLLGIEHPENQARIRDEYIRQYKSNNGIQVEESSCSIPLAAKIVAGIEAENLGDPSSVQSILKQQLLRAVSLLHGASFVCFNKLDFSVASLRKIMHELEHPSPQPIFDGSSSSMISLVIPSAWDSWSKILLLPKSIYYDESSPIQLLNTDTKNKFVTEYARYLDRQTEWTSVNDIFKR